MICNYDKEGREGKHHETDAALTNKIYSYIYLYTCIARGGKEEKEVELMSLGLPLQGPVWTEWACVREGVEEGARGGGGSAWRPAEQTRKMVMCMFLDRCSILGVFSTAYSSPPVS